MLFGRYFPFFLFLLLISVLFCRKVMVQQWSVLSGFIQLHTASLTICTFTNCAQLNMHYMMITYHFWGGGVHACVCMGMFIPGILYLKMHLHKVRTFPFNPTCCNWSHVLQMRGFQTLLGFSGSWPTCKSCGFGPGLVQHYRFLLVQKKGR